MLAAASWGRGQELADAAPGLNRIDDLVDDPDLQRLAHAARHQFVFTRSGMANASHIRTNRAAFSAERESRQPHLRSGLLAITPTVPPPIRPSPTTMLGAHFSCSSRNELLSGPPSRIARTKRRTS